MVPLSLCFVAPGVADTSTTAMLVATVVMSNAVPDAAEGAATLYADVAVNATAPNAGVTYRTATIRADVVVNAAASDVTIR